MENIILFIPLSVLIFLPDSIQKKRISLEWKIKPDEKVLYAYEDCNEWIQLGIESICASSTKRMNEIIIPEMDRRGLARPPLRSLSQRANEDLHELYRKKYPHIDFG
jgi:hypothetical protein